MKILLIDDCEIDTKIVTRILQNAGYSVKSCPSYEEAQEILNEGFDCIIIDYLLKNGVTSVECIKKIRKSDVFMPIIVITSHEDDRVIVRNLKAGANDYISKNKINNSNLDELIRENVSNSKTLITTIKRQLEAIKLFEKKLLEYADKS